jgi:hypothetical protein
MEFKRSFPIFQASWIWKSYIEYRNKVRVLAALTTVSAKVFALRSHRLAVWLVGRHLVRVTALTCTLKAQQTVEHNVFVPMEKSFRPVVSAPSQDQMRHVPFTSSRVRTDIAFRSSSNAMEITTAETCRMRFNARPSLAFQVSSSVVVEDVFQERGDVTMTTTVEICLTNQHTARFPLVRRISFSATMDDALLSDGFAIEMTIATMAATKETAV